MLLLLLLLLPLLLRLPTHWSADAHVFRAATSPRECAFSASIVEFTDDNLV